ncbi:MAG: coproporphyrinogen dehydrogenase HemZ [Clostridiales bacterium]|jgi:oxygen-independent coproporphyrinogen-3 oxidase|nr:coproporphyrinogen dehydrogenase HemZ [Clostridiales bacterium]
MYAILQGHSCVYDIQAITQIFFPNEKFTQVNAVPDQGVTALSRLENGECLGQVYVDGVLRESHSMFTDAIGLDPKPKLDPKNPRAVIPAAVPGGGDHDYDHDHELRRKLMMSLFIACKAYTGLKTPWGALTGVRPSKMARLMLAQGFSRAQMVRALEKNYWTHPDKVHLSIDVALAEEKILARQLADAFSLYIGVPFCPTRCLYCSFVSYPFEKNADRIDAYLTVLKKELAAVARFTRGRPLQSLYIGGGTPTALPEKYLDELLAAAIEYFGRPVSEFSVEAGRPDTITREKLRILKSYAVSRISINPQSLHDETLARIGRRHTAEDCLRAFTLARDEGFDDINMDVILGLPGETKDHAAETLAGIGRLRPESVTVHTLTIKRASLLRETLASYPLAEMDALEEMLCDSREKCREMGMAPYYMYRQKNMLGNFENVGYCLPDRESFYNVVIMEETQDIWAVGAGAVSKLLDKSADRITRIFNVKSLDDYMGRIDEMIRRKEEFLC